METTSAKRKWKTIEVRRRDSVPHRFQRCFRVVSLNHSVCFFFCFLFSVSFLLYSFRVGPIEHVLVSVTVLFIDQMLRTLSCQLLLCFGLPCYLGPSMKTEARQQKQSNSISLTGRRRAGYHCTLSIFLIRCHFNFYTTNGNIIFMSIRSTAKCENRVEGEKNRNKRASCACCVYVSSSIKFASS